MSTIKPGDVMLTKSCRMVRVLASRDDGAVAMRDYRSRVAVRSVDTDRLSYHSEHELTLVQPPATPQEPSGAQLALADIERAYSETEVALAQVVSRNDKELFFNGDKALRAHLQKNLDYYRIRRDGVRALLALLATQQAAMRRLVEQWRKDARESSASGPELIYSDCASALAALLPPQAEP